MAGVAEYKVLGQEVPGASWVLLYEVPVGRQAIVSTLTACYLGTTGQDTYSVQVRPAGEAEAPRHYLVSARAGGVAPSGTGEVGATDAMSLGLTLAAGDRVMVRASAPDAYAIHAYGTEIQ